jgi:hypothetical protein
MLVDEEGVLRFASDAVEIPGYEIRMQRIIWPPFEWKTLGKSFLPVELVQFSLRTIRTQSTALLAP